MEQDLFWSIRDRVTTPFSWAYFIFDHQKRVVVKSENYLTILQAVLVYSDLLGVKLSPASPLSSFDSHSFANTGESPFS